MAVDIGAEAIDRATYLSSGMTLVNKTHPATISGSITSIDVWANSDITGLRVGTFYTTNGNTLKCRDSEAIAGTIVAGSKVTKAVSIAVEIGDYIGLFFTIGRVESDTSGYAGRWWISGEYIDPGDEAVYALAANQGFSLGGYIELVVVGRSYGFIIG